MYTLQVANSKYGKIGREISNYEFNKIPLADQKMFRKFNYQEGAVPIPAEVSLKGGAGDVERSGISGQVSGIASV
jgi:hypothetical protein